MIKKILILGLVAYAGFLFYRYFMADTLEQFFRRHKGNVDFFQQKLPDYNVHE